MKGGHTAAVLCNHRGEAMSGGSFLFDHVLNTPSADGLALKNGMILADELGCSRVIVESDCLELINACNGVAEILSPYSTILAGCFHPAQRIGSVSFVHCPREANMVAHSLVR